MKLKVLSKPSSNGVLESVTTDKSEAEVKFPKSIGVIFLIGTGEYHYIKKNRKNFHPYDKKKLFDPLPCAHLLLQLNTIQDIFNYQIISTTKLPKNKDNKEIQIRIPTKEDNGQLFQAFDLLLKDIESIPDFQMDYWVGLTSLNINTKVKVHGRPAGSFYEVFDKEVPNEEGKKMPSQSGKIMALVTASLWEKYFCPPSLFEYMSITTFMCSLHFLSREFGGRVGGHKPNGCIFDHTMERKFYRVSMSNPSVCQPCMLKIRNLETLINNKTTSKIGLVDSVEKFLKLDWAGDPAKWNTPLYNLKKNYKYDVQHNSGFTKSSWEQFKERIMLSIPDKIATGLIGVVLGLIIALIANFLPEYSKFLKP